MRIDSVHLGVRGGSPATHELLQRLLRPHLVDDHDAPANYSVRLAEEPTGDGGPRELNVLYRAGCAVVRSKSPATVLRALLSYLGAHRESRQGRLLLVESLAVVSDGRAVIVPASLERTLAVGERRLADAGLRVLHGPSVALDPATGMVVAVPPIQIDASTATDLGLGAGGDDEAAEARYPVATWVISRVPGRLDPVAPATAVERLLAMSYNARAVGAERTLMALVSAVDGATLLAGGSLPPKDAVAWLGSLGG